MAEVNHREESSGNIFADLNIPEPSLYLAKAELANQICTVIQERNLTQLSNADALPVVLRRSARMRLQRYIRC